MALRVNTSGTQLEVVTLAEAKQWLSMSDVDDWDDLIQFLIYSSISKSQKVSGTSFWPVTVSVTGNKAHEYVYPIGPVTTLLDDPDDCSEYEAYEYEAGFAEGEFPDDLKEAVKQRIATGFKERENSLEVALSKATQTSVEIELAYREDLYL